MFRPFLLTLLLLPHLLLASPDIVIEARPRVTNEYTRTMIRVEPNQANRKLVLEWYKYKGFENRKWYDLQGEASQVVFRDLIKFEESGEWTVRAILVRSDDSQKVDWTTVVVRRPGDME